MTIKATATVYVYPTPSPNAAFIGREALGSEGVHWRSSERQRYYVLEGSLQRRPFRVD